MEKTVYLIRHAQSIANKKRLYNCTLEDDEGLSLEGKKQAKILAKKFKKIKISKIYSSPFRRTIQTALEIAKITNAKIEIFQEFGELGCGQWNGKTEDEIKRKFDAAWKGWHYDPQNNPIPGGESLLQVQTRVLPKFGEITKRTNENRVCIVTHYCVMNVLLCSLVSSLANFRSFDTQNGTIAQISMNNVPRLIRYYRK